MIHVKKKILNTSYVVLDGCVSGWVVSWHHKNDIFVSYITCLNELNKYNLTKIYIDMPVKLASDFNEYPRLSDLRAKKLLGRYHSSIFYAPLETWLNLDYQTINKKCEQNKKPKLSKQSFNLFYKIDQVQKFIKNSSATVIEIHPELLVHYYLTEKKISKKSIEGHLQRVNILVKKLNEEIDYKAVVNTKNILKKEFQSTQLNLDDILDSIIISSTINLLNRKSKRMDKKNKSLSCRLMNFL